MAETTLQKISQHKGLLANINDIKDARIMVSVASGLVTAARREYKASQTIEDTKSYRDNAYNTAVQAGELRLMSEARLGELIQQEQEAGRLAIQGRPDKPDNNVRFLKDYGLTWKDSSRAQTIADNQDLIPQIVAYSTRVGDLPTRSMFENLLRKQPKSPVPPSPVPQITPDDNQNIYTGDYSLLYDKLDDNSVDLFFTDPPYDKDSLDLFEGLAELSQAKLKPGGLCLAYSGQSHLDEIIARMSKHLDYWWTFSIFITGNELRIWSKKLWVRWKPVIAFSKRPTDGRITETWFCDYVQGSGQDKKFHKWGQSVQEATYWIEALAPVNGLVVDPFCGAGTIPLACKLTNRQWLAAEIDTTIADKARQRLINHD